MLVLIHCREHSTRPLNEFDGRGTFVKDEILREDTRTEVHIEMVFTLNPLDGTEKSQHGCGKWVP